MFMAQGDINRDFVGGKTNFEEIWGLTNSIPVRRKLFLFSESGTSFCTSGSSVRISGTGSFCASGLSVGSSGTGSPRKLTGESSEMEINSVGNQVQS